MRPVQFEFNLKFFNDAGRKDVLRLSNGSIALALVKNPRARRYLLRLRPDGSARVTIPRGGSMGEGRKFAERNIPWLERQLEQLSTRRKGPERWVVGSAVYFRGEILKIEAIDDCSADRIRLG